MADSAQSPGEADGAATAEPDVDLTELTIPERIALATSQQPAMGLFLVVLTLFAFTFVIALALVYPIVAGLFVLGTLAVLAVGAAVFVVFRRDR
ncbi:hypothetical protein [Halohasta salina]|uniref:hypothetical protein n=1 Tax=Halohasta salina TaxID=2961621 RepID=UPI0020A5C2A2|nr:hypothetical protein [Halohasta salina]